MDKIYLYTIDSYEAKYQFLSNKRENTDFDNYGKIRILIILKVLLNTQMDDVYKIMKNKIQNRKLKC